MAISFFKRKTPATSVDRLVTAQQEHDMATQDHIASLETRIAALRTEIAAIKPAAPPDLTNLTNTVTQLEADIKALAATVATPQ